MKSAEKKSASTSRNYRRKFVQENGYLKESDCYSNICSNLRSYKEQDKINRRALRSKASHIRKVRNQNNRFRGIEVIEWDDLEIITFNPRNKKHKKHLQILRLNPRNSKRQKLVSRLETEFCRLYSRYRRAAERALERTTVVYEVQDKERKYAALAAITCLQKGVTPRQVFEYWHENIKHFKRANTMTIPSLSFLSSAANIDTVACSLVPDKDDPKKKRVKVKEPEIRPSFGNSFSDTSGLDVRLRERLTKAGYDTTKYNDRYLMTVQKTGLALAMGRDIFVPESEIGEMSRWVAENLYAT